MTKLRFGFMVAVAFIAFHVIVIGGAGAYVAHLAGFDVPFLDHRHAAADELSGPAAAMIERLKTEEAFRGMTLRRLAGASHHRLGHEATDHQGRGRLAAGNAPCGYPRAGSRRHGSPTEG